MPDQVRHDKGVYLGLAPLIACQTFSGVAGMEMSFTPSSDSASTMALIAAGGEPIAPT